MTFQPHTIIEPFRIKSVEPISTTTPEQREAALVAAGYNLFALPASAVLIDLLTDSGTGAMSAQQWGGMLQGDESYAGSNSFYKLERAVRAITGFKHVIPTHSSCCDNGGTHHGDRIICRDRGRLRRAGA